MRIAALLLLCTAAGHAYKPRSPLKTKKYKCVEVADDMEIQVVPKTASYEIQRPEEELRLIGSASIARPPMGPAGIARPPAEDEQITVPQARKVPLKKHDAKVVPAPQVAQNVPRDKQGRPLLLSPEHCQQVQRYARQYGVTDVLSWVERNCTFAKMFLPTATCEEINTLVASCYRMKFL